MLRKISRKCRYLKRRVKENVQKEKKSGYLKRRVKENVKEMWIPKEKGYTDECRMSRK